LSVHDIITEQDEAQSHQHTFCLWPKMWQEYSKTTNRSFKWRENKFAITEVEKVPDKAGLYTFLIEPRVANHPSCSYLMYVGQTGNLRIRFQQYLKEKDRESGRPKVVRLLNKYPDYLFFCYTILSNTQNIDILEQALISAYIPPCNDRLPASINKVVEALR